MHLVAGDAQVTERGLWVLKLVVLAEPAQGLSLLDEIALRFYLVPPVVNECPESAAEVHKKN